MGVHNYRTYLDSIVGELAPEWPIEQIAAVDRNVLRVAIYELLFEPDIPPKVAINEAVELALEQVKERHEGEFSEKMMKEIAETIGVGAVKYYIAKYSPEKKIVIDWKEVMRLEGESAPYIQYAYVRTQGIFRKHKGIIQNAEPALLTHETEKNLVRLFAKFPQLVQEVATNYTIHQIANYALEVADKFNEFG